MICLLANLLVLCISAVKGKYLHRCIDGCHESSLQHDQVGKAIDGLELLFSTRRGSWQVSSAEHVG